MHEPVLSRLAGIGAALRERALGRAFGLLEQVKTRRYVTGLAGVQIPDPPRGTVATFKHSGNSGDVIYAIPAMQALAGELPLAIRLRLDVLDRRQARGHPAGSVRLNRRMFDMLRPLLLAQPGVASCEVHTGDPVDYDLDLVRDYPFPLHIGHIARSYFLTFAIHADLGQPWLRVQPDTTFHDCIVLARSARYHAPGIDYGFLRRFPRTVFVGVEEEFQDMRRMIPGLQFHAVTDFLQMAQVIGGSQLFIGNQSLPFALAEGLKARRMLEVCHLCPNVIVEGPGGFDFCYQPQFEQLVGRLMA